ncbi:MerR family transcriptional regulator [Saccharopolyspora dendranthemae]|uniref:MerR family transcriptional regulator n=1 Tax=Saccharopolyspora dendranthemae TaxID=1181886 RepID=UPI001FE4CB82|nr:MerR family transcriptional regulator [Saccharopolyspora dendranthemae]
MSTGEAAKAIGVDRRTLQRWATEGAVEPALVTAGGHQRWDVEDLKAQLRKKRQSES